MTRRVKVACATITPSGKRVRIGYAAPRASTVKAGNCKFARRDRASFAAPRISGIDAEFAQSFHLAHART